MTRLATGIQGFDGMVQGGLPVGSSVILQGPPGQEKLSFALTFLAEGLKAGASGLVIISSQSPDAVLGELRNLGVDMDAVTNEHRLRIVDWYSWSEESVHDIEERGLVVRSSIDLVDLGVSLSRAIASLSGDQPRRAVIELLSPATNVYEITQVYAFAQSAKKKFDRYGFTSLVLLEKDMHSGSEITTLHQPFDGVVEIERTRSGDRIVRKIGVLHLKDTAPDPTFRVLEIAPSGIRVVREAPKAATAPPTVSAGAVLESQEERARRLTLIMQIARERLKLNPRDTDALFAMAAAQATLDDARGGLESLERLSELEPNYPGLWVLKTKLHARVGEADRARQSRMRAQEVETPEPTPAEPTVPCPMCDTPVAVDATTCGNCGVKFAPTRKLEDELEDLGHAAIQEMVHEGFQEETPPAPPRRPAERRVPEPEPKVAPAPKAEVAPPPKPAPKPVPKKGLTNGLVLGRGTGRRTGMTNGLKGRTNGLRGRTNGLTNGLGRTNGLTNGVGHTNGLTNGLGRTNGLTNGLGRTNGLTNGLGRTNGLTNGLGRTNGLTNGLGGRRPSGFRSTGFRGMMRTAGWKLYVIPLVVVGLMLMPLFFVPEYNGPVTPIRIDGQFGDWTSVSTAAMGFGSGLNPNVDVVRFGVVDNLGPTAFYVQVAGSALAGGGASPGTMDTVRILVDTDGSSATGYRVDGFGADRMIEVSGYAGAIVTSSLWEFDSNRDTHDWSGWIKGTSTPSAVSGSQIEAQAEWLTLGAPPSAVLVSVHTASWDWQTDAGDFPVSPGTGTVSVVADPQPPNVLGGNAVPLLQLTLRAHGQAVSVDSLQVQLIGTAAPMSADSLRLMQGPSVIAQTVPSLRDVTFSFAALQIAAESSTTLSVVGDFTATSGETFGVRLPPSHPFGLAGHTVGLRTNAGTRLVGYLGSPPSTPQVDGAFDEWTLSSSDPPADPAPRANANIDLTRYGAQRSGGSTFLFADVSGRILSGTSVPEAPRATPPRPPTPTPDTDRDTVPDSLDPLPIDFNNDGTPDAQTNGDYDGDLVTDYGFVSGTDYWLNTTLPGSFPPPYANLPVSVFIGPVERPPALGEDALRIFLDLDNSTLSGYMIGGIGADRLIEVRGKDGAVTQSALLAFSGSFPGEWAWNPLLPVTVGLGYRAIELSVVLSATGVYMEASDFWGSADSTAVVPALAPMFTSFKVSAADQPLSVPWAQVGPQPSGTLIDGGSNSVTTVYNHQRKVVRAGDVAGDTACDATNSDGCWYAVFYDQLAEVTATTAASTETITTGTSCGGTFPTDIQTSNNVYKCYREAAGPTFQDISAIAASTGIDVTVTLPAHATNDILLLLGWVRDVDDTVTVSGWTAISGTPFDRGTTSRYWMFWKRAASSSETNPLFDKSGTTGDTYAAVITYRGAITSGNPWEVVGATSTGTADPASITGITTLTANALVVVPVGGEDNNNGAITTTGTNPAAYTEHYLDSATGTDGAITFSEALRTTAGATGTISVDWDIAVPIGWGGKALSLAAPASPNYQLSVQYDFTSVPTGDSYTLKVEAFHTSGEDILVQVVDSTETTWTTRMTITKTSDDNADQTYTLTTDEYDGGSPNIRFIGATESGDTTQNDLSIDRARIDTNSLWDRIVLMRSSDTAGSTWGSQIILASGRSGDSPLLYPYDSSEPSIAIDSGGLLHVVWVSASATGNQNTFDRVRYARTTVTYPTQGELASAANWDFQERTDYYPGTETITTGSGCGGTFPTDLQSSNNVYRCLREAGVGGSSIAFDAASSAQGKDVSSLSWSHTASGANRLLVVGVAIRINATQTVSSVTYAGTGLTFIRADQIAASVRSELWYLVNPATGLNTVQVTLSAAFTTAGAGAISLTGVAQTSTLDANNGATGTSTTPSATVTTVADNAWVVDSLAFRSFGNGAPTGTAGAGQTERWSQYTEGGGTGPNIRGKGSHEGPKTPAGGVVMNWSLSDSVDWAISGASFKPNPGDYRLSVRHDWSGIPTDGNSYDVCVEADITNAGGESMLFQVLTPPSTWNTRITLTKTSDFNTDQCYTLTSAEFNSGAPSIRWISGTETGDSTQSDIDIDQERVIRKSVKIVDDASPGFMPTVSTDSANTPHIAWSGSKTSGTVYYKNKAAAVDHDFAEQTTRQTTTSATYGDITGASLPSTDFTAGRKYLLVFTAQLDASNTAGNAYIQALHGSTAFAGSEFSFQTDVAASRFTYYWFVVWTAVSAEGVKLQFRSQTAGDTTGADQITTFKLDLGDLTENTDWFFNEDTAGDSITTTTWDGLASTTFTPSAASNWLVMATMRGDPDSATVNYESRIGRTGEATETQPLQTWEGNDATNDRYVQTLARVYSLTAVSNTFTQESRCDAACTYPRSYSSVFALNLNKFEDFTSVYTEAEITLSTTDFATQIQTASLTPTRAGDVWILGEAAIDVGTVGNYHKMRLQVDNVDQPGTQTSDAYTQADAWDPADEFVTAIQTVENLAASSHTFDLDASREGTTAVAEDRVLFAVALSIRLGGAWKATVSWGTTYTGLSVDVSPQNDYVSLARFFDAATDEIQYTVCKNLATSNCDASAEFTKWDGTAGADTVVTAPEVASYPSLAHTFEANGDVWVAYAKDVDGTTRAIYARYLDYPSGGWQAAETVDSLTNTIFTKPSIGIDKNNDVHALYVATSGPQVYYNKRTSGTWGTRTAVDTSSDNPTLMVRAPNDVTYGTPVGGLYWKTTTSETYFYIPEFDAALLPVLGVLALGLLYRRKVRGKQFADSHAAKTFEPCTPPTGGSDEQHLLAE